MSESTQLGKYKILKKVGRGGFATVYKARDTTLNRIIALKILHPHIAEDDVFIKRFYQEASIAANLRHSNIVIVHEVGERDGQHYLAMSFLPGQTLEALLAAAQQPLPLEQIAAIVEQLANALDYIHNRGLIHRDVKPSNIIIDDAGQATLLDFGIVRAADGTQVTTTGTIIGTPQYMSPEQAEGEKVDARSDIYSLGVVAYRMCTGQPPFNDVSSLVVLRLHADKLPPSPHEINPQLPVDVGRVLLKALAKKRDERYQTAGELARALKQAGKFGTDVQLDRSSQPAIWIRVVIGVLAIILLLALGKFALDLISVEDLTPTPTLTATVALVPTDTPMVVIPPTETLPPATPTPTDIPAPTSTPTPTLVPDNTAISLQSASIFVSPDANSTVLGGIRVGEQVEILGRSSYGDWFYVSYQNVEGFAYAPRFEWSGDYESLIIVSSPSPVTLTPTSTIPYSTLTMDLWDIPGSIGCSNGAWYKSVYINGKGGDDVYTYYWNGEIVAGPTSEDYSFQVSNPDGPIIGIGKVVSGDGQEVEMQIHIAGTDC
ncbi:MAG: protein kinase [Chloroflexi bacterium]|nr:protein kinase [Chloroflexota bacterium]